MAQQDGTIETHTQDNITAGSKLTPVQWALPNPFPRAGDSCFSSRERCCSLLIWFFFGHFLLICPRPWQWKHRPSLKCCCLASLVRRCVCLVVVPVAISVG